MNIPSQNSRFTYIIISPVRDEEKFIDKTIQSVISQSILPAEWIIVNDGSTDTTVDIIKKQAATFSWIKRIDLLDRGHRLPGRGVVDAFYVGFNHIITSDWKFIVKLDCDLSFNSNYFSDLFMEFEKNPRLGIASGKTYLPIKGNINRLRLEWCPDSCTRGASKIYRRECFSEIRGIRRERGWDTLDDVAAMARGYEVRSFKQYQIVHYRPIGTKTNMHRGIKSRYLMGGHFYYLGYHPLFMFFKSLKSIVMDRPFILAGVAMFISYFLSMIAKSPRIEDELLIKQYQSIQLKRIFRRKIT